MKGKTSMPSRAAILTSWSKKSHCRSEKAGFSGSTAPQ